jgi:ABC-type multidrug transport system fused ATPase/permease subunit
MSSARFLWRMRPYARQVAGELVLGSVCGIIMNTAVVLPALLLGRAVDQVVALSRGETTPSAVTLAAFLFVGGTLATEVPRIGKRWWLMTANNRIRANIRADVFRGVVAWPMARLHRTPIGDLMARTVGDVEVLGVGVREFTIEIWDTVLFCISFVVAMLVIDAPLTALALLPVPVALLVAHAVGRWVTKRTTISRQVNARLTAAIHEYLAGIRVLRLFGRRVAAVEQVAALSQQQARANLDLIRMRTGLQPAYSTLMTAGIVAVVWLGGERVLSGAMTIGVFVAFLELFARLVGRGFRIPQLVNSVQSGAAAYARLEPLLAPPLSVVNELRFASFLPGRLVALDSRFCRLGCRRRPGWRSAAHGRCQDDPAVTASAATANIVPGACPSMAATSNSTTNAQNVQTIQRVGSLCLEGDSSSRSRFHFPGHVHEEGSSRNPAKMRTPSGSLAVTSFWRNETAAPFGRMQLPACAANVQVKRAPGCAMGKTFRTSTR